MEDAYVAIGSLSKATGLVGQSTSADTGLFAVFDGHGGPETAKFCAKHLPHSILMNDSPDVVHVLCDSFVDVDRKLARIGRDMRVTEPGHPDHVGCTAVACLIRTDDIVVANAGDSRAVLSRGGHAVDLSRDHKPNLSMEGARIANAGGYVTKQRCGTQTIHRVNGQLAVSRAMGDLRFKSNPDLEPEEQIVSCMPEVRVCRRRPKDEFLVIACDGIWDVLTSQDVVDRVQKDLSAIRNGSLKPSDVVGKILDECLAEDPSQGIGTDNMTMILVIFDKNNNIDAARVGHEPVPAGRSNSRSVACLPGAPHLPDSLKVWPQQGLRRNLVDRILGAEEENSAHVHTSRRRRAMDFAAEWTLPAGLWIPRGKKDCEEAPSVNKSVEVPVGKSAKAPGSVAQTAGWLRGMVNAKA